MEYYTAMTMNILLKHATNMAASQNRIRKTYQTKKYIFYYFIYIKVKNIQNLPMVVECMTVVNFNEEGIGKEYKGAFVKQVMFIFVGSGHIGRFTL